MKMKRQSKSSSKRASKNKKSQKSLRRSQKAQGKLSKKSTKYETEALLNVSKAHPILHRYFGFCMYKSAMKFRGMMDEALAKYGLMTPQLGILRVIHESGLISQQDIGDFVVIDKASMVKFIDLLEKNKLVSRQSHETDRRVKLVSLTPKGIKTLDEVTEIRKDVEDLFLQPLSEEEKTQLRAIVPKLILG